MKGRIFDIQRFSIHDGPGICTTVFLQGCPMRCLWCHNPEGMGTVPLLSYMPDKCVGCGYCVRTCPHAAHSFASDGRHVLDRSRCRACGACTAECYAGALELVGRDVTEAEVIEVVLRDWPFYETSGGGLTLSGGEPLMQIEFTATLLAAAKRHGLRCCIETCGFAPFASFERVLPHVDLFLYDLKETDPARHLDYTGRPNALILANLRALHDRGARIRLRLPVIPGYNDRPEHFAAVSALARALPDLCGVEIMPYHRLGTSKLARLGLEGLRRESSVAPNRATVAGWMAQCEALGLHLVNQTA